jgi:hypothetical protein
MCTYRYGERKAIHQRFFGFRGVFLANKTRRGEKKGERREEEASAGGRCTYSGSLLADPVACGFLLLLYFILYVYAAA